MITAKRHFTIIFLLGINLVFASCSTIPSEAPELSQELGKRISAIKDSNLALLHSYFVMKRDNIDKFIQDEWIPVFAEEVFSNPLVEDAWDTIVSEDNKNDRLQFIITFGPELQQKINQKRNELISPLNNIEDKIERNIINEYNQAIAINNALTSFLLSSSKVSENRSRVLSNLGISDSNVNDYIAKVDGIVEDLLASSQNVEQITEKSDQYKSKMQDLLNSL